MQNIEILSIREKLLASLFLLGINVSMAQIVQKEYINPGNGYTQVVAVTSGKVKTIYVSGQIGEGADLEAQTRSVFVNLKKQLNAAGADFSDVVRMNTYIVNYHEGLLEPFRAIRKTFLGDKNLPASTLLGVSSLARKELLIEVDATAIVEVH